MQTGVSTSQNDDAFISLALVPRSAASPGLQVTVTPGQFASALTGQPLRLTCSGIEEGSEVVATQWSPHPVAGYQESDGALYFHNYPARTPGIVEYTCTKRSASGQATGSVQVVAVPPTGSAR